MSFIFSDPAKENLLTKIGVELLTWVCGQPIEFDVSLQWPNKTRNYMILSKFWWNPKWTFHTNKFIHDRYYFKICYLFIKLYFVIVELLIHHSGVRNDPHLATDQITVDLLDKLYEKCWRTKTWNYTIKIIRSKDWIIIMKLLNILQIPLKVLVFLKDPQCFAWLCLRHLNKCMGITSAVPCWVSDVWQCIKRSVWE